MSRLVGCVLLLVGVAAVADDTDPEPVSPPEAELKKLQGTWELTKVVLGGTDQTKEKKGATLVFQKNRLTLNDGPNKAEQLTVTLDPKQKPPHIDLSPANDNRPVKGIYKLQKDELTIAFTEAGQERPKDFDAKGVRGLLVMKRQKPK